MEYIVWCDESVKEGRYFSNFYGGILVSSKDLYNVKKKLEKTKQRLNLQGELKWQKVTQNYLPKYKNIMDKFFNFVTDNQIKVRIMFTKTSQVQSDLTNYHLEHEYQILYYHFLRYAFGFQYSNPTNKIINLRVYFDKLPDHKEKNKRFKNFIYDLKNSNEYKMGKIFIRKEDITEVSSQDHIFLQCLDVVLGAMAFRLNDLHKKKIPGKRKRGKRTKAKEELYKYILGCIRCIFPYFNVGITTGKKGNQKNIWNHPYRHWLFVPSQFIFNDTKTK
ncbi:MAG: hypothetical protein AMJ42_05210 [Deltaproteobacteria bacterium DG_8]|nr:MAG: hypothetical protein AMJ42_05210 [Deltaproteobacteria bacterium DG_8]